MGFYITLIIKPRYSVESISLFIQFGRRVAREFLNIVDGKKRRCILSIPTERYVIIVVRFSTNPHSIGTTKPKFQYQ